VVSLGTSLPEIAAHAVASLQILLGVGNPRILSATVLGGNIGSDVVQQTLVLGLVVLLVGGFRFSYKFLLRGYVPMIGTTLLTLLLAWDRTLTRVDGMILLTFFTAYTYGLYTTRSDILQQQGTQLPVHDTETGYGRLGGRPPRCPPRRSFSVSIRRLLRGSNGSRGITDRRHRARSRFRLAGDGHRHRRIARRRRGLSQER